MCKGHVARQRPTIRRWGGEGLGGSRQKKKEDKINQ
jgi:hypothetical protein